MNAFNAKELAEDESGLLESCDFCNQLIHNWDCLQMSFLQEDGKTILCLHCWNEKRRQILIDKANQV